MPLSQQLGACAKCRGQSQVCQMFALLAWPSRTWECTGCELLQQRGLPAGCTSEHLCYCRWLIASVVSVASLLANAGPACTLPACAWSLSFV